MLYGRERERARITALLDDASAGRGGALVLRGQPGAGKSALLQDAAEHADRMQVLSTRGIESESPLAFAALQRLLRPVGRHVERLPAPQASALRTAFGEANEPYGDRFLVFLAGLSLLAEAAEQAPVLCVIDDAHWLDDASAAALLFIARRLGQERVALLFAAREGDMRRFDSEDLPDLVIGGLDAAGADALLAQQAGIAVSAEVRDELMRQTAGNALALVELPATLTADQLRGVTPLPPQPPLTERLQAVFLDRTRRLTPAVQTLLLVAAADDSGRLAVVRRAAAVLGATADALEEAERSGLLAVHGPQLELRHPLVRSALYQAATSSARRQAHAALATAMTGAEDEDRRAWHLAAAADEPDETVVAELDRAGERAQRRGGYEAASAAFARAAELTVHDELRARRLLAAATNDWLAGRLARAAALVEDARHRTADPVVRADLDRLRGRIEFNIGSVPAAIRIWSQAARDVADADIDRARLLGVLATASSTFTGPADRTDLDAAWLAAAIGTDGTARERCISGLLTGFGHLLRDDLSSAAPALRAAFAACVHLSEPDLLTNTGIAAFHLGDDAAFGRCFTRLLEQSRGSGAVGLVLFALPRLTLADLCTGRWADAAGHAREALELARSTGQHALTAMPLAVLALQAALRGEHDVERHLADLDQVMAGRSTGILGLLVRDARRWALGVRELVAGRYQEALHQFEQLIQLPFVRLTAYDWLEAAVQAGRPDAATARLGELERFADAADSPPARAVVAHGRALLTEGANAEEHFRNALDQHAHAGRPFDTARTRLAYGELLRRARRRVDAREHLRAALATFEDLGANPWVERARQELRASGESARKRDDSTTVQLTAQERQVARQVAQGLSNREVAAQLFLSPRTIDFHLRNVFAKTGISSRGALVRLDLG